MHNKIKKELNKLNFSLKHMMHNYILLDKIHLEVLPHHGLFLKYGLKLYDSYPIILVLDHNKESLNYTEKLLEGSLCLLETLEVDIKNINLSIDDGKFDTIALNFVLDKYNGSKEIEKTLLEYKNLLKDGGAIFGSTIVSNLKHKKDSLEYIKSENENKKWYNLSITLEELEAIFTNNFDDYYIDIEGSCVVFRLHMNKAPIDINKHKPTLENVGNKYLKL
jgi:hypothetical protein